MSGKRMREIGVLKVKGLIIMGLEGFEFSKCGLLTV